MPINLVPENRTTKGAPERIDLTCLEKSMSLILELIWQIDNPIDNQPSLKGWLQARIEQGETITPDELSKPLDDLVTVLREIHEQLAQARRAATNGNGRAA